MDVPSAANLQIGKGESLKIAWFLAIHVPQATKRGIEHTLSSGASYRHLCHAYSTSYPSHFYRILIRRNVSFHRLMLKGHVRNTWCTDSSLSLHSEHHRGPISPLLKSKNYIYWKKKRIPPHPLQWIKNFISIDSFGQQNKIALANNANTL